MLTASDHERRKKKKRKATKDVGREEAASERLLRPFISTIKADDAIFVRARRHWKKKNVDMHAAAEENQRPKLFLSEIEAFSFILFCNFFIFGMIVSLLKLNNH